MEILFRDAQHRAELAQVLRQQPGNAPFLVLDTCQRFEIYGLGVPEVPAELIGQRWTEADAVERLARIATGLFSRITGELEILGQVRTAY
ncbi:MAG: hypothetical protein KDB61_12470, partial [Planctomycetes bacterium]|nr:hypothetical protein [Planctomycetota bacterium]